MYDVWTKDNCIWCVRVCDLLAQHGIGFRKVMATKTGCLEHGFKTLPQVFDIEGHVIGGYEATKAYLLKQPSLVTE